MKKILAVLLTIMLLFSAAVAVSEEISITATTFPLYSIAKMIAGDQVKVVLAENHAEMSGTIVFSLDRQEASDGTFVVCAEGILDIMEGETDPLTNPTNGLKMARELEDQLEKADQEHAGYYREQWNNFVTEFIELYNDFQANMNHSTKIWCEDGSMGYFAAEFGVVIAEDGIVLSTFNHPADDEKELTYIELMRKNLEKVKNAE